MKVSETGLKLIQKYEGCHLQAYRDPVGIWTIGYGHTKGVSAGQVITRQQAEQFLREDVERAESAVDRYYGIYHWTQCQYDALVSFAYNVGSIDQLTKKGKRTIQQISTMISAYNKGNGKVLPGLVRRRAEEQKLFDQTECESCTGATDINQNPDNAREDKEIDMPTIRRGSKGKAVKVWQIIVGADPDGDFGSETEKQTKEFQEAHGLEVDGIAGPVSWKTGLESLG